MLVMDLSPDWKQRTLDLQWNVLCVTCIFAFQLLICRNKEYVLHGFGQGYRSQDLS